MAKRAILGDSETPPALSIVDPEAFCGVGFSRIGLLGRAPRLGVGAIPAAAQAPAAPFPDPTVPVGALLGKIGNSAPFAIGMQTQPLAMPASGRLMLGLNDDQRSDNSGFFTVTVTKP